VTNLGIGDVVNVLLSTDGGATFTSTLATGVSAAAKQRTMFAVPQLAVPTASARIRVVWANAPPGFAAGGTSPANFRVEPPFVRLTSPNGGETWTTGSTASITWIHNLGLLESVRLDLSTDAGATYGTVLTPATGSDGSQSVGVVAAWVTPAAGLRIAWVRNTAVSDVADHPFTVR
jgi:hypothetical protein